MLKTKPVRAPKRRGPGVPTLSTGLLKINVSRFNILSEFAQTFVLSVSKLLNARCKERCWLLSMPLKNDWLHLGIQYDANFCPPSILLHQTWTACSLRKTVIAIIILDASQNESDLHYFLAYKNAITTRCSLRDDFSGNVAIFIVSKWRHSDVIVIKLTAATRN